MAQIQKGVVTEVKSGGEKGILRPLGYGDSVTPELPVQKIKVKKPAFEAHGENHPEQEWEELHPEIKIGDTVVFTLFDDGTGLIIDKIGG